MLLVRSRYALRGRKELKSELGGEERRVTQSREREGIWPHAIWLHCIQNHGPAAAVNVDLN